MQQHEVPTPIKTPSACWLCCLLAVLPAGCAACRLCCPLNLMLALLFAVGIRSQRDAGAQRPCFTGTRPMPPPPTSRPHPGSCNGMPHIHQAIAASQQRSNAVAHVLNPTMSEQLCCAHGPSAAAAALTTAYILMCPLQCAKHPSWTAAPPHPPAPRPPPAAASAWPASPPAPSRA